MQQKNKNAASSVEKQGHKHACKVPDFMWTMAINALNRLCRQSSIYAVSSVAYQSLAEQLTYR
jgi:hypothetical protein